MGILVNGRFLCLGSLQHLRDKLCDGYTLTIKLKRSPDTEKPKDLQDRNVKLMAFVSHTFPESVLKDHHENLFSYQVKTLTLKWSEIFEIMERARVTYEIDDYTVGQTTLEQIFIGFARMQREPTETSKKRCFGLFCDDSIWSNYIIPTHEVL